MSIEKKIEKALINYLRAEHRIDAISAAFSFTAMERGWFTGCDTCGHGADEDTLYFYINYTQEEDKWGALKMEGDPIQFLPTLFAHDEED